MTDRTDVPLPGPAGGVDDEGLPAARPRGVGRRILSGLLTYGVVILCVVFLIRSIQGEDFTTAIALITWPQVAIICVLGVVNLATNLPPMAICLPGLRYREAAVTNTASAALSNTVPEGGAIATGLNYAMLRSWGFRLSDITSEVIVTGTWSQMTKYTLLAIGLCADLAAGLGPGRPRLGRAHLDGARDRGARPAGAHPAVHGASPPGWALDRLAVPPRREGREGLEAAGHGEAAPDFRGSWCGFCATAGDGSPSR